MQKKEKKRYMHLSVHCSIIYNSQAMGATCMLYIYCIHIYIIQYSYKLKYYSAIKKGHLVICGNMNGPRGYYAKWNKSDREIQILYDFTFMWNLKIKTNEQT